MESTGVLRWVFELSASFWRSIGLVTLLVGLSLLYGGPATLAVVNSSAFPIVQEVPDSVADNATAADAPSGTEQERRMKQRLLTVALMSGVLLMLLAFGYGYLRLELTTRGFYSGRLQIAAGIASLSVVTVAYFLWRWLIN